MADHDARATRPHDIFISYASRDQDSADRIVRAIEKRGMKCWISSRDIRPGTDYQGSIVAALEQASIVLLVFSQSTNASSEVPKEMSLASSRRKPVIPARIEEVMPAGALAYQLTHAQFTDLFRDFDGRLNDLCAYLDEMLKAAGQTERTAIGVARTRKLANLLVMAGGGALLVTGVVLLGVDVSGRPAPPWLATILHAATRQSMPPGGPPVPVQGGETARGADPSSTPPAIPQAPPPPVVSPADQSARAFALTYYATLSGPDDAVLPYLANATGGRLNFYGQSVSRSRFLSIEGGYLRKWPDRRFTIRPHSLHFDCAGQAQCLVTGVVEYDLRSAARNAAASGAEAFSLRLDGIGIAPTITDIVGVATARTGATVSH